MYVLKCLSFNDKTMNDWQNQSIQVFFNKQPSSVAIYLFINSDWTTTIIQNQCGDKTKK